jgi:hypothetical protein
VNNVVTFLADPKNQMFISVIATFVLTQIIKRRWWKPGTDIAKKQATAAIVAVVATFCQQLLASRLDFGILIQVAMAAWAGATLVHAVGGRSIESMLPGDPCTKCPKDAEK